MDVEVRPCRDDDELKSYGRVVGYVFAINERDELDRELELVRPEWTMCAFADGQVVSSYAAVPFTVRLNGRPVQMGGVTGVGTLPGYRRQGLLRKTMTAGLAAMHEQRQAFAVLWASFGAIYQRFGYGLAAPNIGYRFDPQTVELLPGPAPSGRCNLVPTEYALATIRPIYEAYAKPRNLLLERSDFMWKKDSLHPGEDRILHVAVYRNGNDEPTGYIAYTTHEGEEVPGPNQLMEVKDIAWLDLDAYRGIWEYIRSHDLVREVTMQFLVGEDDPMQAMLAEPRMLNKRVSDGIWMRVVDVELALGQRPYGDAGKLTIEVTDELLAWNAGRWSFETDGDETRVSRTTSTPDLTMPVATLATLLAGHRNASFCARAGALQSESPEAVALADRIFTTTYAPCMQNDF